MATGQVPNRLLTKCKLGKYQREFIEDNAYKDEEIDYSMKLRKLQVSGKKTKNS